MARYLKLSNADQYIDGFALLALCQKLVREPIGTPAGGAGTPDDPYVMKVPHQWVHRWRVSPKEPEIYYTIAGRLVCKDGKLYLSDIGPAYLKGKTKEANLQKAKGNFLDGTKPGWIPGQPTANFSRPTANFSQADEAAWLERNTLKDPTYVAGAQMIVNPKLIYEQSHKHLIAANPSEPPGKEAQAPATWKDLRHSPVIAKAIRALLQGKPLPFTNGPGKFDANYSRKQFMLPVFTLAIFLAEPARNERAWPINLMLLDLAENSVTGFTWDAILWHPDAININPASTNLANPVAGPRGKKPNERDLVSITDANQLYLVGGLLPASPSGGGERGKPAVYTEPRPLHPNQVARGQTQGPGAVNTSTPFDYIHQKEIDVLLKWLLRIDGIRESWSLFAGSPLAGTLIDPAAILGADIPTNQDLSQKLTLIRTKIRERITRFEVM